MGAAAVVTQRQDRLHAEPTNFRHTLVGPTEIMLLWAVGRDPLPQRRVAQLANAEIREQREVFQTVLVAAAQRLVEPAIAHPIDGAFMAAPKFHGRPCLPCRGRFAFTHVSVSVASSERTTEVYVKGSANKSLDKMS
jgi:hypothetical protein